MQKNPKITIGICAYNVEQYIYQALKSAMDQTYKNLEIIVIDDGSSDGTGFIIDRLAAEDDRVIAIHKANKGHAAGREQIVAMMTGKCVYWLDSDDFLLPEAVANNLAIMQAHHADIVKTVITEPEMKFCGSYTRDEYMKILLPDRIKSNVIGCLIRRKMYSGVHHHIGFINEDYYTFTRLIDNARKIVVEGSRTYHYRQARPGSVTYDGRDSFKGYYPRAMHRADRFERYRKEFPEECKVVLKQFVDYACMACLFAPKGDGRVLEVRNLMAGLEREITFCDAVSGYKKWLIRQILNHSVFVGPARLFHEGRGRARVLAERARAS